MRTGDKPFSEPMMARLHRHICVSRPHWVKVKWWMWFNRLSLCRAVDETSTYHLSSQTVLVNFTTVRTVGIRRQLSSPTFLGRISVIEFNIDVFILNSAGNLEISSSRCRQNRGEWFRTFLDYEFKKNVYCSMLWYENIEHKIIQIIRIFVFLCIQKYRLLN